MEGNAVATSGGGFPVGLNEDHPLYMPLCGGFIWGCGFTAMDPVALVVALVLLIAGWYSVASLVMPRRTRREVAACSRGCRLTRVVAMATSYLAEYSCDWAPYVGIFVQRLPWDNPFNLAAAVLAGRRGFAVVKVKPPRVPGWRVDISARGRGGEEVNGYRGYWRSTPRAALEALAAWGRELGIGRVVLGEPPGVILYMSGTYCGDVLGRTMEFVDRLNKMLAGNKT